MDNKCLIDTDILSEFLKGNENVIEKVKNYLNFNQNLSFSIITYYEILNGLIFKDAKKQIANFENFVALNSIIPLTQESVKISAKIYADLRTQGKDIGHTDSLIAGIAISNKMKLITNNEKHFSRIKNLKVDNWKK